MGRLCLLWTVLGVACCASAAWASCPTERTSHCGSFSYQAGGQRFHVSAIRFALNGRAPCSHARTLIKNWLRHRSTRISDTVEHATWYEVSRNPYEFTAGLCGDLVFRL